MSAGWSVTDVLDMQGDEVRFAHVAKHLYRASENWKQIVPGLVRARQCACEAGCVASKLMDAYPRLEDASDACRKHVLADHDNHLAPTYRRELLTADAAGRVAALQDGPRAWGFVGDGGVFVIVRLVGTPRQPEVKTAYRVVPTHGSGSTEDFRRAAVRKLRDKSLVKGGGI